MASSMHGSQCAAELKKNRKVGPGKPFLAGGITPMFDVAGDYTSPGIQHCQWNGVGNTGGYLGLKFVVSGQTYYGWASVSLTSDGPTITGYAYENVAGTGILTGAMNGPKGQSEDQSSAAEAPSVPSQQPATLGLLAFGSTGLGAWRRPEEMN